MDGNNSGGSKNLVEKIPAIDISNNMILTTPSAGPQPQDQIGGNGPCFIMCIDASGRLLRIPMSVFQKQAVTSVNKTANEIQDKQKTPVATIAPWTTPTQVTQESPTPHLQRPSTLPQQVVNHHQQIVNQQALVGQAQQITHQIPIEQQQLLSQQLAGQQQQQQQQQPINKLHFIGQQQYISIQQPSEKLQFLTQRHPINIQFNIKQPQPNQHSSLNKQQCLVQQPHKIPTEQLAPQQQQPQQLQQQPQQLQQQPQINLQQLINHYGSLPQQGPVKHQLTQGLQSINLQTLNQLQIGNKHQLMGQQPSFIQKQSIPRQHTIQQHTAQQPLQQSVNIPHNLNLLTVLQNGKILQSRSQLQFQNLSSSMISAFPKSLLIEKTQSIPQNSTSNHSARIGNHSIQANAYQNWGSSQPSQENPKHDTSDLFQQNINICFSVDKNIVNENVNGKSMLSAHNLNVHVSSPALPTLKTDSIDRQLNPQGTSNGSFVQTEQVIASQEQLVNNYQFPSKSSFATLNNFGNALVNTNTSNSMFYRSSDEVLNLHANVFQQFETFQKGQNTQKSVDLDQEKFPEQMKSVDLDQEKFPEQMKSDKSLQNMQSQFIVLDNKCSQVFQISTPKQIAFPLPTTSTNMQCSNKTFASPVGLSAPHVHQASTMTLVTSQANTHVLKSMNGLKPVGNVQAIVNALQLPQINGLSLSNLSPIHILSSSGLTINSRDQVVLLPSQNSTKFHPALVQTDNPNFMQQLCNLSSSNKLLQNPAMFVQNPLLRLSVTSTSSVDSSPVVCSKQLKNTDTTLFSTSCSLKPGSCDDQAKVLTSSNLDSSQQLSVPTNSNQQNYNIQSSSSSQSEQFAVGQEYHLSCSNGLQVIAVWDGKYFKVKFPTNANVSSPKTSQATNEESKNEFRQLSGQLDESKRGPDSDVLDNQSPVKASKRTFQREEGKYAICRRCGGMSLDYIKCENCNHLLPDDIQFVVPDKKLRLINDPNIFTAPNNRQPTTTNKPTDNKRSKKNTSKKSSAASPKKDAEIVHILSSDDEESHSSLQDDLNKASSPPSSLSSTICPLSTSIPFSGFRVNIRSIYFGKISCDWLNTLTFDRKSVNLLSDSFSGSYCLSACGSEVMLVAAYFDTNKNCTYLFLQVNHSSAIKLFDRIFTNSKSLYDPLSKDDCAKYIVLFLDDEQTNLMELIPCVVESMQMCNHASHPVYKTIENFEVGAFLKSVKLSGDPILEKESVIVSRKCQEEDNDETNEQPVGSFNGKIINLFTYPPPPATGGITVTNEDLFCLNEGEFLNDVIIDFYLKYLSNEMLADKFKNSHIFSSFFYRRLTRKVPKKNDEEGFSNMTIQQRRHAHVRTWTRHVDLFSKDFIVVPINESAHWFLAIICYPGLTTIEYETRCENNSNADQVFIEKPGKGRGKRLKVQLEKNYMTKKMPCILIFDSLSGPSRGGVIKLLRDYLQVEWDLKKKSELGERQFNRDVLKGTAPECPQQTNFSDCGIYILQYVESFFTNPITDYTFPIQQPSNWFDERKICKKRAELQQLILDMQKTHNPGLDYNPDQNGCIIKSHDADT